MFSGRYNYQVQIRKMLKRELAEINGANHGKASIDKPNSGIAAVSRKLTKIMGSLFGNK